jgi:hypothetical protein
VRRCLLTLPSDPAASASPLAWIILGVVVVLLLVLVVVALEVTLRLSLRVLTNRKTVASTSPASFRTWTAAAWWWARFLGLVLLCWLWSRGGSSRRGASAGVTG